MDAATAELLKKKGLIGQASQDQQLMALLNNRAAGPDYGLSDQDKQSVGTYIQNPEYQRRQEMLQNAPDQAKHDPILQNMLSGMMGVGSIENVGGKGLGLLRGITQEGNVADATKLFQERGQAAPSLDAKLNQIHGNEAKVIGNEQTPLRDVFNETRKVNNLKERYTDDVQAHNMPFEDFKIWMNKVKGKDYSEPELAELYRTELQAAAEEGKPVNAYRGRDVGLSVDDVKTAEAQGNAGRRAQLKPIISELDPIKAKFQNDPASVTSDEAQRYELLRSKYQELTKGPQRNSTQYFPEIKDAEIKQFTPPTEPGEIQSTPGQVIGNKKQSLKETARAASQKNIDDLGSYSGKISDLEGKAETGRLTDQDRAILDQYAKEITSKHMRTSEYSANHELRNISKVLERAENPPYEFVKNQKGVDILKVKTEKPVNYHGDINLTDPSPKDISAAVEKARAQGNRRVYIYETPDNLAQLTPKQGTDLAIPENSSPSNAGNNRSENVLSLVQALQNKGRK